MPTGVPVPEADFDLMDQDISTAPVTAQLVFQPGDVVSFCGEQATVVDNDGTKGWVAIDDVTYVRWRWKFEGAEVKLIKRKADQ